MHTSSCWSWTGELMPAIPEQRRTFHASRELRAKDPYGVLGVAKDSTTSDIKKSYYQVRERRAGSCRDQADLGSGPSSPKSTIPTRTRTSQPRRSSSRSRRHTMCVDSLSEGVLATDR